MPSRLAIVLALALLAGCASSPPPAVTVTPPTVNESTGGPSNGTTDETPPTLVDGENDDMRVVLARHSANASATTFDLDVRNKRGDDVLLKYAHIRSESGTFYFDLSQLVPAGQERRVHAEDDSSQPGDRMAPWLEISIYYTNAPGTSSAHDGAATLDLRGRGLP